MAAKLDPKVVDALLDKLSSDDQFRELFTRDPDAALNQVGHKPPGPPPPGAKPGPAPGDCLRVTKLASKDAIKTARGDLRKLLTAELGLQPHRLEA